MTILGAPPIDSLGAALAEALAIRPSAAELLERARRRAARRARLRALLAGWGGAA